MATNRGESESTEHSAVKEMVMEIKYYYKEDKNQSFISRLLENYLINFRIKFFMNYFSILIIFTQECGSL